MSSKYTFRGDPDSVTSAVKSFIENGGKFHKVIGYSAERPKSGWAFDDHGLIAPYSEDGLVPDGVVAEVVSPVSVDSPPADTGDEYGQWVQQSMDKAGDALVAVGFAVETIDLGPEGGFMNMREGLDLLGQIFLATTDAGRPLMETVVLVYYEAEKRELIITPRNG